MATIMTTTTGTPTIITMLPTATITTMTEVPAGSGLLKLMTWLSPAFPVGSFSYSHGLESAAAAGLVGNADDLRDWLAALVRIGSGWNDAVLFAEAWQRTRSEDDLGELAELGAALASSRERHLETTLQGAAFAAALRNGWPEPAVDLPDPCPYPVAVGAAAAAHGIALEAALSAWLQAFVANLAQASIRLGITGQAGAVSLVAALEPIIAESAHFAAQSSLDDLGSATVLAEVMSMRHETHYSRLFRT
jgi:urease accessory protein